MRTTFATIALAGLAAAASAQSETQSQMLTWSSDEIDLASLTFDAFDDMGGTRQLNGVQMTMAGSLGYEITVQNFDPVEYAAGEWSVESSYQANILFDEGPSAAFGGIFVEGLTGDLGAGMGGGPFGGEPGNPAVIQAYSGSLDSTRNFGLSSLGYFSTGSTVEAIYIPFTEFLLTPPPNIGFINSFASFVSVDAQVSLTYDYTVVPAPGGAAVIGIGLLGAARRRR